MSTLASSLPPEDECRDQVLRVLHGHLRKARGMRQSGMLQRDLQTSLRDLGFKMQQVVRNLSYLVEKGWVTELRDQRRIRTKSGMEVENERRTYRISDAGIDRIEGASVYQQNPAKYGGINISQISGVVVLGDGNYVNQKYSDLARSIDGLAKAVEASEELDDNEKLEASANLTCIRAQLVKAEPDRTFIQRLWSGLEHIATVSDCIAFAQLVQNGLRIAGLL